MTSSRFEVSRVRGAPVSDAQLLADLKRVAELLGGNSVSQPLYSKHGRFDTKNLARRFGSWNAALAAAGLDISNEGEYPDERLFANILALWQHYGRQPRRRELAHAPSTISQSPYSRRFGSWTSALESFVEYANAAETNTPIPAVGVPNSRASGRDPSLRLRFKVLQRDRFSCHVCGASPAKRVGVELHVDHIRPWSAGG